MRAYGARREKFSVFLKTFTELSARPAGDFEYAAQSFFSLFPFFPSLLGHAARPPNSPCFLLPFLTSLVRPAHPPYRLLFPPTSLSESFSFLFSGDGPRGGGEKEGLPCLEIWTKDVEGWRRRSWTEGWFTARRTKRRRGRKGRRDTG